MKKQTAGRDQLGAFAPKFAELNDDLLFGEVWSREEQLSPRDRSLITCASLLTQDVPQLEAHMNIAKQNGVTKEEMVELITHLAFYTGWPKAWSAFALAKEIFGE
ncbi:4-carboxymuconolactone decarboxylase [Enterococcus sp. AZ170]|uniref:carboxymuconolactone decarboxylase family protein n=1 Tax=unclassified Enterococcus TaxID=2608891 RepID=UPI003D2680F5